MTLIPIELAITEITWNKTLLRWFATFNIKNASSPIHLTEGDVLKITDLSKEYSIELQVKSIEKAVQESKS